MVGFEQDSYTVRETDGQREVCVILTDPSSEEELLFDIDIVLTFETRTGSAGRNTYDTHCVHTCMANI